MPRKLNRNSTVKDGERLVATRDITHSTGTVRRGDSVTVRKVECTGDVLSQARGDFVQTEYRAQRGHQGDKLDMLLTTRNLKLFSRG